MALGRHLYRQFGVDTSFATHVQHVEKFDFETHPEHATHTPERLLWRAVILQCWNDALARKVGENLPTTPEDRDEARRFLLSNLTPWREDRIETCRLAGLDSDDCYRRAKLILEPIMERERQADAQHVESPEERRKREASLRTAEERERAERSKRAKLAAGDRAKRVCQPVKWSAAEWLSFATQSAKLMSEPELDVVLSLAAKAEQRELKAAKIAAGMLKARAEREAVAA